MNGVRCICGASEVSYPWGRWRWWMTRTDRARSLTELVITAVQVRTRTSALQPVWRPALQSDQQTSVSAI
jgi:hypothetical protein